MREHGGIADVVVAMNGIDPVEQRDAETRGGGLVLTRHVGPGASPVVGGIGVSTAEHRPQLVVLHVVRAGGEGLALNHLSDLLVRIELAQDLGRLRLACIRRLPGTDRER